MREEVRDFLLLSVRPGGEASVLFEDSAEVDLGMEAEVLGDGGAKMAQKMMFEMPLWSSVSFGRMTMEQLDGLPEALNG